MTVKIPSAFGVPGISGPPDWTSAPPAGSYRLDDVRWNGATSRTFGGGASQNPSLRATTQSDLKVVYLSFRAPFVQELSDNNDFVFVGLQKTGSAEAMVIRIQVHSGFAHTGPPPDNNPPGKAFSVQVSTLQGGNWTLSATPEWVNPVAVPPFLNSWVQSSTAFPTDPNNRWAVGLKIPVAAAGPINNDDGPNLGTDFKMWYFIQGSVAGAPTRLADSGLPANPTNQLNLVQGIYPLPGVWDQYQLTSGPGTEGGIAISWGDVLVNNAAYGQGYKIANGQLNTFIARPRNYTLTPIPAGAINATFRIANWGSVSMDPNQIDFGTGVWDYVPGNSEITPVLSNTAIPTLPAGNNPPATSPISLDATMNLGAGKSLHQCILVTLSGTNLTFLNSSLYTNMNFDQASLLERQAEISIVGLEPVSAQPRDVYLAIEKVNMPRSAPGTNEGRLLEASMARLMERGGPLAEKLKSAQAILSDEGDFGSGARIESLLQTLRDALAGIENRDIQNSPGALEQFAASLTRWLTSVKAEEDAAKRLAAVFDALADWLAASAQDADTRLTAFISQLRQWLLGLGNDPASLQLVPPVLRNFGVWLSTLGGGGGLQGPVGNLFEWFQGGRPAAQLASILDGLRQALAAISLKNAALAGSLASFSSGTANWLRGAERLDVLVNVLSNVGLTSDELDELFPTVRIHVYHDSGDRLPAPDGTSLPVLRTQSSFGVYTYHEGGLEGWQTSIQGAQRIADNLYLLAVPNNGTTKVKLRVQAVQQGEERIPEDPIRPIEWEKRGGCLSLILNLLGLVKKKK